MVTISSKLQQAANNLINNVFHARPGQSVLFHAGEENLDLAYAFAKACGAKGLETFVISNADQVRADVLKKGKVEELSFEPLFLQKAIEHADWFVYMTGSNHNMKLFSDPELVQKSMEIANNRKWSFDQILQHCINHKTHLVAFLDPSLQQAEALGLSYEAAKDRFIESLDIDYAALHQLGEKIIQRMQGVNEIHLTAPNGTDLKLKPGNRKWINDDGYLEDKSEIDKRFIHNFPFGEVFVAPLEDSAEGVFFAETLPGSSIDGLKIEFRGKENAVVSAKTGGEMVKQRLERATGNPYRIAEFAIGTNPCADPLLATEKAYATCHIAIGQNTWLGGENECSVHWDVLVYEPTVKLDGVTIMKDGKFLLD